MAYREAADHVGQLSQSRGKSSCAKTNLGQACVPENCWEVQSVSQAELLCPREAWTMPRGAMEG